MLVNKIRRNDEKNEHLVLKDSKKDKEGRKILFSKTGKKEDRRRCSVR